MVCAVGDVEPLPLLLCKQNATSVHQSLTESKPLETHLMPLDGTENRIAGEAERVAPFHLFNAICVVFLELFPPRIPFHSLPSWHAHPPAENPSRMLRLEPDFLTSP